MFFSHVDTSSFTRHYGIVRNIVVGKSSGKSQVDTRRKAKGVSGVENEIQYQNRRRSRGHPETAGAGGITCMQSG